MSKLSDTIEKARAASRERLNNAKDVTVELASETTVVARERMSESKARAAELLGQGREIVTERAAATTAATKEAARNAAEKSSETIAKNPFTVVAGGIALGALVAALLPKSKVEQKYVSGAGKKITGTAKTAFEAAKETGQEQIESLGLNSDSLREQFKDLFGKAIEAAKSAANAAGDAVKNEKSDK
ncbi:hypothetical protein MNBD_ALPHA04-94 [hydrothermal vent metagenome]|uniref:DUF883 domain-containing protein n=1 Tax=hydrothermal vent metagenome TaxID=652676 RepID=A0A3B0SDE5_9ZZZZ